MAQSMISTVVGLIVVIVAAMLVTQHYRREHHKEGWLQRFNGHELWEKMRHRH
jgi:hypothetical protein